MNYQQNVDTQINLMKELLEETRKTNFLLADLFAEQLDSNALIEDALLVALNLDSNDEDEFDDEDDIFFFDDDDEDEDDEDDDYCGNFYCPVCGTEDFDDDEEDFEDEDDDEDDDEDEYEDFEDEDDERCGYEGCEICYPENFVKEPELSFKEVEEKAYSDCIRLTSEPQLPIRYFGFIEGYQYSPNSLNPIEVLIIPEKNRVIAMLKDTNGKVVRRGIARCMPNDRFSAKIGCAIALHRLFELDIPEIYTR